MQAKKRYHLIKYGRTVHYERTKEDREERLGKRLQTGPKASLKPNVVKWGLLH